jgi:hypothetical protein
MCLNILVCDGPCKKCFVAVGGLDVIYHHSNWQCVKPEPTEEEFQRLWIAREERMQAFRDKYGVGSPVPEGTRLREPIDE